jgi:hypothetical protein
METASRRRRVRRSTTGLAAAQVVAALLLAGCFDPRGDAQQRTASARVAAENAVLIGAYQPKSIVFRNERVLLRDGGAMVCGEFDGRTRSRQMAGYSRFIFDGKDVVFDRKQPGFEALWRTACLRG